MNVVSFVPRDDVQKRIKNALISAQFVVDTVDSARECILLGGLVHYQGVLVDSHALVFEDSRSLVKLVRQTNPDAAIFMLSPILDLEQRLGLFEVGVDDCIREPFFAHELIARLRLCIRLRRRASDLTRSINLLRAGDLTMDLLRRTVSRSGKAIDLRAKEFVLLEYFIRNANRPITRTMLLNHVWKSSFEGLTNVVDVYISSLRAKLDRDFEQKLIQTNRGVGYTFICLESCSPAEQQQNITARLSSG